LFFINSSYDPISICSFSGVGGGIGFVGFDGGIIILAVGFCICGGITGAFPPGTTGGIIGEFTPCG